MAATSASAAWLEGWLVKKATSSPFKMSWKRRYCVLRIVGGELEFSYYEKRDSAAPKKDPITIFGDASIGRVDVHRVADEFEIDNGRQKLYARADATCVGEMSGTWLGDREPPKTAAEVCDAWVQALRDALARGRTSFVAGARPAASASKTTASKPATAMTASPTKQAAPAAATAAAAAAAASSAPHSPSKAAASASSSAGTAAGPLTRSTPALPDEDDWEPRILGSGSGGVDRLIGTTQPRGKSLADIVREAKRHIAKAISWGGNAYGQLGNGSPNTSGLSALQEIGVLSGRNQPIAVAAGAQHAAVLTKEGQCFVCGGGDRGQLGCTEGLTLSARPYLLVALRRERIVSVACGAYHSLFALSDGRVMACGDGELWGQLGCGRLMRAWTPVPVVGLPSGRGPAAVFAGSVTSGVIFGDGSCFMWGGNTAGQCGFVPTSDAADQVSILTPRELTIDAVALTEDDDARVVQAACGELFTLFVVGQHRHVIIAGVLGLSRADTDRALSGDRDVLRTRSDDVDIELALRPAYVSPLDPSEGTSHRMKDVISASRRRTEALIEKRSKGRPTLGNALDIAAGPMHAVVVVSSGNVYTAGRGVLGYPADSEIVQNSVNSEDAAADGITDSMLATAWCASDEFARVTTLGLQGIAGASCGEHFTVVGSRSGRLYAWGIGDMAQLGTGRFAPVVEPVECSVTAVAGHHIEAFACGGDFCVALQYPGARGEARERELARKYAAIWLHKTHGRVLGASVGPSQAAAIVDDIAAELAKAAGLGDLLNDPSIAALMR